MPASIEDVRSLETELSRARELDTEKLAETIESIGFECTRCGACCKGVTDEDDPDNSEHVATVFPDEVRELQTSRDYDWRDVARPVPYGLEEDGSGETFEWALQTDSCGDCTFYTETAGGEGTCQAHADRPLICRTYPFSVVLGGTSQPMGDVVERHGVVRAHECEGLGREITRAEAESLAETLKQRAVRELEEAIAVRDNYESHHDTDTTVVHDSEGPKTRDGDPVSE